MKYSLLGVVILLAFAVMAALAIPFTPNLAARAVLLLVAVYFVAVVLWHCRVRHPNPMKYSLRERILRLQNQIAASGMILFAGLAAIWLPMMLAQFASEFWTTPIHSVLSMLAAIVIASPLLWIAWEAWKQAWRRPATSEPPLPKRRLASNPQVPSWGKPPPLPDSSAPAPNPPKE
jgi:Predicted exporters of the RND superfamily